MRSPSKSVNFSRASFISRRRVEETERLPRQPRLRIALFEICAAMLGGGLETSNGAGGTEGPPSIEEYV